jgi:hypothetical protein
MAAYLVGTKESPADHFSGASRSSGGYSVLLFFLCNKNGEIPKWVCGRLSSDQARRQTDEPTMRFAVWLFRGTPSIVGLITNSLSDRGCSSENAGYYI